METGQSVTRIVAQAVRSRLRRLCKCLHGPRRLAAYRNLAYYNFDQQYEFNKGSHWNNGLPNWWLDPDEVQLREEALDRLYRRAWRLHMIAFRQENVIPVMLPVSFCRYGRDKRKGFVPMCGGSKASLPDAPVPVVSTAKVMLT